MLLARRKSHSNNDSWRPVSLGALMRSCKCSLPKKTESSGSNASASIRPGAKVLYLGAASGTSVSHVADIVGNDGTVYAVEFSHRSGRDLINMATHRTNIIPIIEDARHPLRKYTLGYQ